MKQDKLWEKYHKKLNTLHGKKEKLFEEGKIQAWDLSPEDAKIETGKLKGDKALAMKLILHKVVIINNCRKLIHSKIII